MENDYGYYYMVFVLGYDLLHSYFGNSEYLESDLVFDKCIDIYNAFLESDYDNDMLPEYECLERYVNDIILSKSDVYLGD